MRNDGVSKLYKFSQQMVKLNKGLFVLNFVCVVLSCFLSEVYLPITTILQIVFSLAFVVVEILDDGIFWFCAESARRANCIENAFHVDLSEYKTEGYYNNDLSPSFAKYTLNIFESHYFTANISKKMLPKKIVEVIVALLIFVVSCLCIPSEITAIVAEAIFSSFVMIDAVAMIIYEIRIRQLYKNAYTQFVSVGITKYEQLVWVLSYVVEYESIKAHYKIRLDEKIFNRLNPMLSKEWDELKKKIIILPEEVERFRE